MSPARASRTAAAPSVETFLAALEHPEKPAILALRTLVLQAAPGISELVKWNAPSFETSAGDFATIRLNAKQGVQLILHLGVKPRPDSPARATMADPAGLLEWKAADRAVVTFADHAAVVAHAGAVQALVRQWITFLA